MERIHRTQLHIFRCINIHYNLGYSIQSLYLNGYFPVSSAALDGEHFGVTYDLFKRTPSSDNALNKTGHTFYLFWVKFLTCIWGVLMRELCHDTSFHPKSSARIRTMFGGCFLFLYFFFPLTLIHSKIRLIVTKSIFMVHIFKRRNLRYVHLIRWNHADWAKCIYL